MHEAVGARTLDEMLGAKVTLDRGIEIFARAKVEAHGVLLKSVGIKDVVRIQVPVQ